VLALAGTRVGHFLTDDWHTLALASQFGPSNLLDVFALAPGQWHWRPLPNLLWALEWDVFGLDPAGYAAVKAAMLAAGAFLVGTLARRLSGGSTAIGAFAAALFALHPLGSGPWIWVSANHENVLLLAFLLGLLALERYARGEGGLAAVVLAAGAAMLSKETGAVFPGAVLLHALLVAERGPARSRALRAFAATAALVGAYAALRLARGAVPFGEEGYPFPSAWGMLRGLAIDPFRWIVAPVSRSAFGANAGSVVAAFLVVLLAAVGPWLLAGAPRRRIVGFAVSLVPLAMIPVAPFFATGLSPADWEGLYVAHYLLLPAAAFVLAFALAFGAQGWPSRKIAVAFAIGIVGLYGAVLQRNHVPWKEAGAIARAFAAGIRAHLPDREAGRPLYVYFVGAPASHRGIQIGAGSAIQVALEKRFPLPAYPTDRGLAGDEVARFLERVAEAVPYKVFFVEDRERALALARGPLERGESLEDVLALEWDAAARRLEPLELR